MDEATAITGESRWSPGRNRHYMLLGVLIGIVSFLVSFVGVPAIHLLVGLVLIALSFSPSMFVALVLPTLACFAAYGGGVPVEIELEFLSPHSTTPIGSFWPYCILAFTLGSLDFSRFRIPLTPLIAVLALAIIITFGSVYFVNVYGANPVLNKEPIRLMIFVTLGVLASSALAERVAENKAVAIGGIYVLLVSLIAHRIVAFGLLDLKDVGGYTYLSIPLAVTLALVSRRERSSALFYFALVAFLMSFRVSRTEIILFAVFLPILFLTSRRYGAMVVAGGAGFLGFGAIVALDSAYVSYFLHKINFFSALGPDALASIGGSALVRWYELVNIVAGYGADTMTLLFGRGLLGFITFDVHSSLIVYYDGAFSIEEYRADRFYRLHFFVNELLFYFGIVGSVVLITVYRLVLGTIGWLVLPFAVYLLMNGMFRMELLVLTPFYVALLRRIALEKGNGRVNTATA